MGASQQILLAAQAAAGGGGFTWNPADTHADFTLSNGNKTATNSVGGNWRSTRGTIALATGKYWEVHADNNTSAFYLVGIGNLSAPLTNYVGSDSNGYAYLVQNKNKYNNGSQGIYGSGSTTPPLTLGFAYNTNNGGEIYVAIDNSWLAGSDPSTGVNPMFTGVGTSGLYAMASMFNSGCAVTLRTLTADLAYAAPSGYAGY